MERKNRLEFFRYLCTVDINGLDQAGVGELYGQVSVVSGSTVFAGSKQRGAGAYWISDSALDESRRFLENLQADFKNRYKAIFSAIIDADPPDGWFGSGFFTVFEGSPGIPTEYPKERGEINILQSPIENPIPANFRLTGSISPDLETKISDDGGQQHRWPENWRETARIKLQAAPENLLNGLFVAFLQAIDGLPPAAFKWCAEPKCGIGFVQLGKREKLFCSQQCAARKLTRDKRQERKERGGKEYQRELTAGRKRAAASYKKKKRASKK